MKVLLEHNGFELAERTQHEIVAFATEQTDILAVEFGLTFRCTDISQTGRADGSLKVDGDGYYNTKQKTFFKLGELGAELRWRDADGNEQLRRNVVARFGPIALGHADVTHTTRYQLD